MTLNCDPGSSSNAANYKQEAPRWYATVQWSNWVLVLVAAITAWVIWIQAKETGKAAAASAQSADALVNAERAWLTGKVEDMKGGGNIIWIIIPIKNTGKTTAKIKRIVATRMTVKNPPDNTSIIEDRDFIISPGEEFKGLRVFIWPQDMQQITNKDVSLYVYGFVEYLDTVKGQEHKKCFCELYWLPDKAVNEPQGFMVPLLVHAAYLCAT